jgi:hypothetical protein
VHDEDRRFDRLQRTKAAKADLKRVATKDDLDRFATVAEMSLRFDSLNDN